MQTIITNEEALKELGFRVNAESLTLLLEIVFGAVFFYALLRALYQWFAGNGVRFPAWVGKCLLLEDILPAEAIPAEPERRKGREIIAFLTVFLLALFSRALIAYLGYLFKVTEAVNSGYPSYDFFESFSNIWNRWDAPHYVDIAQNGYVTEAQAELLGDDSYLFIVFFPLLPMLMRLFWPFAPDVATAGIKALNRYYFAVGSGISTICFAVAAWYLYKLVRREQGSRVAAWAVAFLMLTPAGFFFFNTYTDSLLLMCSVIFFYHLHRGKYLYAGIFGLLAALSRSLGVLLVVPFFVEWVDREGVFRRGSGAFWSKFKKLLPVLWIPAGTGIYLLINQAVFGDPLRFLTYQREHWGQHFSFFIKNLADIGVRVFTADQNLAWATWLPGFVSIAAAILAFFFGSGKKLRASYLAYMMIYIVFAAAPSWLLSGMRYFAVMFPGYILLARRADKQPLLGGIAAVLMLAGLACMTLMFISGWHVM